MQTRFKGSKTMYSMTIGLALLLMPTFAVADTYWLVGSHSDRASALADATRISAEIGTAVSLHNGDKRYRILTEIMDDEADRRALRRQLEAAGVGTIFILDYGSHTPSLEQVFASKTEAMSDADDLAMAVKDDPDEADLAEIDSLFDGDDVMADSKYAVIASFASEDNATALAMGLGVPGYAVIVRPAIVNAALFHRVLVGPVPDAEAADVKAQLVDLGYRDIWMLPGISVTSSYQLER